MGNLYVVATPIGNLNDMTKRAIDTLKEVDIILCEDTRTSLKLLNYFEIKNKLVSYHKFNEMDKVDSVISDLKDGKNIALISDAGTPCISDPGYILVNKAREEGILVYGVGGISAFVTALSVSGLNTDKFTFMGFFPRENKDKNEVIDFIENSSVNTYVFYESPKRIIKTLEFIYQNLGNVKVCVSRELTKLHEVSYYGFIGEVLKQISNDDNYLKGEYTFVLEKEISIKKENEISIESLLINEIIKNNITLKEAISKLNSENSNFSKKEIYNAGLNLKEIVNKL